MNQALLLYSALVTLLLLTSWLVPEDYDSLLHRKTNIISDLTQERKEQLIDEIVVPSENFVWREEFKQELDTALNFASEAPKTVGKLELKEMEYIAKSKLIPIEDFSSNKDALKRFSNKLSQRDRSTRVAFLGDSYCEGDIITADLREQLQSLYGGRGVGFIPFAPIDEWRKSVMVRSSGWQTYNAIFTKSIDKSLIWINNQYYFPTPDARVSIKFNNTKHFIDSVQRVSLVFKNAGYSRIKTKTNSSALQIHDIEPSSNAQVLNIDDLAGINQLDISFEKSEQFIGFGLYANDTTGVYVDNYSLRSANGLRQSWVDQKLSSEITEHYPVDLVILQYGLNVAYPGEKQYNSYRKRMAETIHHLKKQLPEADFLLVGVGDRSTKVNGRMQTMDGIEAMVEAQKSIAKETGIAFWNTFEAMGGVNSMVQFVEREKPLAAKDYTHINYAGGKFIGTSLTNALINERQKHDQTSKYTR
ncbi:MAG: hypothetical protein ACRC6V_18485 [Bacteroidales bacterium]